mmetsp:Transcript_126212/g.403382  ORF Transcript_126212/g.403382 Transcript_126212/m.403382 type:complete len:237 (-) Transcript_126212:40-750(-)
MTTSKSLSCSLAGCWDSAGSCNASPSSLRKASASTCPACSLAPRRCKTQPRFTRLCKARNGWASCSMASLSLAAAASNSPLCTSSPAAAAAACPPPTAAPAAVCGSSKSADVGAAADPADTPAGRVPATAAMGVPSTVALSSTQLLPEDAEGVASPGPAEGIKPLGPTSPHGGGAVATAGRALRRAPRWRNGGGWAQAWRLSRRAGREAQAGKRLALASGGLQPWASFPATLADIQ